MRTQLLLMVGGAALLAGCTVDSNYQPATGYSAAPAGYTTYQTVQPGYQVQPAYQVQAVQPGYQVTYYQPAPQPVYPFYSPEGSPADANDGSSSK